VVDLAAAAEALGTGRLAGAAFDVFDPEPPPPDHPILRAPNTLFTPHVGARSAASLARMNDVVDDVVRLLQGQPPAFSV
jgi:D-3-phosphoglycerate dehydrogenase